MHIAPTHTLKTPEGRGLGWLGEHPKSPVRSQLVFPSDSLTGLPASVDLSAQCGAVLNQEDEGSCTAHAGVVHARQVYTQDGWHNPFPGSPRMLYFDERRILELPPYNIPNATQKDTGGYSTLVVDALEDWGITAEHNCPYAPADGNPLEYLAVPPDAAAYANAYKHRATTAYQLAQETPVLQACLAAKFTFIFGFLVYASFESPAVVQTGVVPMPGPGEAVLGGHEMVCIGYEMLSNALYFRCRNSWGSMFGAQGDVFMPATYFLDTTLSSNFWSLRVQH